MNCDSIILISLISLTIITFLFFFISNFIKRLKSKRVYIPNNFPIQFLRGCRVKSYDFFGEYSLYFSERDSLNKIYNDNKKYIEEKHSENKHGVKFIFDDYPYGTRYLSNISFNREIENSLVTKKEYQRQVKNSLKNKELNKNKKGKSFKMTKIHRWIIYTAITILVWRFAWNIDSIIMYIIEQI